MTKKLLLASLGAAALFGGEAFAQSGYLGLGAYQSDVEGVSDDVTGATAEASIALGKTGGLGGAFDIALADSDEVDSVVAGTAHLFTRQEGFLVGGFIGATDTENGPTTWYTGGEGQLYLSQATLGAAVTYGRNEELDADGYGVGAAGRFYATDNLAFGANLNWVTINDVDVDATSYGVGAEYLLSFVPVSLTAGYTRLDSDGIEANQFALGARWNFGAGSLKARDRSGASLAGLSGASGFRF